MCAQVIIYKLITISRKKLKKSVCVALILAQHPACSNNFLALVSFYRRLYYTIDEFEKEVSRKLFWLFSQDRKWCSLRARARVCVYRKKEKKSHISQIKQTINDSGHWTGGWVWVHGHDALLIFIHSYTHIYIYIHTHIYIYI